jgi:beta-glucan synthesis-associated protein KRE6
VLRAPRRLLLGVRVRLHARSASAPFRPARAYDLTPAHAGFDNAYISWVTDDKLAWTLLVDGMGADPAVEISARPIPQEPMYLIANLGMSYNFGTVDLDHLTFPTTMKIDYIRVYQRKDSVNIGCDPSDFPTAAYINQ